MSVDVYHALSTRLYEDVKMYFKKDMLLRTNARYSMMFLRELHTSCCVSNEERIQIRDLLKDLERTYGSDLFEKVKSVLLGIMMRGCYPVGSMLRNLTTQSYYWAGYYLARIMAVKDGYDGNIKNFVSYLDAMLGSERDRVIREEVSKLRTAVLRMDDMEALDRLRQSVKAFLVKRARRQGTYPNDDPAGSHCDKRKIFLNYFRRLAQRGIVTTIYLVPGEYQLESLGKDMSREVRFCDRVRANGLKCINLIPKFLEYYSGKKRNSLYIDMAHLTPKGIRLVSSWMSTEE